MSDTIKNVRLKDINGDVIHPEISVDIELNDTSENPVQNKVIKAKLDEVFQSVSNGKSLLETAITDMGGTVSKAGEVATYNELSSSIKKIKIMTDSIKSLNSWLALPATINTKRAGATCCYYNGCIIVRQGRCNDETYPRTWDVYDIATGKCVTFDMGFGNAGYTNKAYEADCLVGNKWYIFGGYDGQSTTDTRVVTFNDDYGINNLKSYRDEFPAKLPIALLLMTANYVNGKIYIAGGSTNDWTYENYMIIYNISTGTFTTSKKGNSKCGHASGVIDGKIYYMGGLSGNSTIVRNNNDIEEYNPTTDTFTTKLSNTSINQFGGSYGVVNNELYLLGGELQKDLLSSYNPEPTNVCVKYNPLTNTITTLSPRVATKTFSANCVIDGNIYSVGGNSMFHAKDANENIQIYVPELEK